MSEVETPDTLTVTNLATFFERDRTVILKSIAFRKIVPVNLEEYNESVAAGGKKKHKRYRIEEVRQALTEWDGQKQDGKQLKVEIDRQRARKLEIENDRKEGLLIPRDVVATEIRKLAAGMNGVRVKAEQEYPRLFAEAGDDLARNATVLREMFDELFGNVQALAALVEFDGEDK